MASACAITGQVEEGLAFWDEALQVVQRTGECWFAADLKRQKGEPLLRQGRGDSAEELITTQP